MRPAAAPRSDVMILLPQFGTGGVERVACLLAAGFAERGLAVCIASVDCDGPVRGLAGPAVRVEPLGAPPEAGLSRRGKMWRALPALAALIRRERPRILLSPGNHCHLIAALALALAGAPRTRLVVKMTNPIVRPGREGFEGQLQVGLYRWIFGRAEAVLSLSRGGAERLKALCPADARKMHFVRNPYVRPGSDEAGPASSPPDGPPMILAVGRLSKQKNLGLLLDALARIGARPWTLTLLGTGPEEAALRERAALLGIADRVTFEGFVADPTPYYRRAHLLALSSRWEDLPAVALEALACGCPVLATDCSPALTELVRRAGHGAVCEGEPERFAGALAEILDRPFFRAGFAVAADYAVEEGVADHLSAIELLLGPEPTETPPVPAPRPRWLLGLSPRGEP